MAKESEWTTDFPESEGDYWFYGDPFFGQMGVDYTPNGKPDLRMYLVKIFKTSNSTLGTTAGQIFHNSKFNREKRRSGYIGKFMKAELPGIPDISELVTNG